MAPTTSREQNTKAPSFPAMSPTDIMGLSCRFPESSSASQFWENLATQRDMVTSDDRRWPVGLHGTPPKSGKILDYDRFDAPFFAVHGKQAQVSSSSTLSCQIASVHIAEWSFDYVADLIHFKITENGPSAKEALGSVLGSVDGFRG